VPRKLGHGRCRIGRTEGTLTRIFIATASAAALGQVPGCGGTIPQIPSHAQDNDFAPKMSPSGKTGPSRIVGAGVSKRHRVRAPSGAHSLIASFLNADPLPIRT
jgi:hypothetical protein